MLDELELNDYKMAHALATRATQHELGPAVEQMKIDRRMPMQLRNDQPVHALQLTLSDWRSALAVQLRCAGEDHPESLKALAKVEALELACLQHHIVTETARLLSDDHR